MFGGAKMAVDASRMCFAAMDLPNATMGRMKKTAMEPAT